MWNEHEIKEGIRFWLTGNLCSVGLPQEYEVLEVVSANEENDHGFLITYIHVDDLEFRDHQSYTHTLEDIYELPKTALEAILQKEKHLEKWIPNIREHIQKLKEKYVNSQ